MKDCPHDTAFEVLGVIACLTDEEEGPVRRWTADVKVRCRTCGMPFRFIGLESGSSPRRPMTSFGNDELRAPIEPAPDAPRWEQPQVAGSA